MKVAIIQSNYIPWKGYFDVIHDVDLFVFYDDVQYTTRDWRNRNKIKTPQGELWLSVPVASGSQAKRICDVAICEPNWGNAHWKSIAHSYAKAPHFKRYAPFFEAIYRERTWTHLSELNQHVIQRISRELLGLETDFVCATTLDARGQKQERLLDVLAKVGATAYVSGPAARDYIDPAGFAAAGIALSFKDYAGYPEYPQVFPPFAHQVSILDLLFHVGPDAGHYIWGWREGAAKTLVVPLASPLPLADRAAAPLGPRP